MSAIELHQEQTPLAVQMQYAQAVSTASMLPDNYRGKPADIMLAVGLGQSMGLSPAESLYRISVIKGKPTASAELIAANVRKAGHRLRIVGSEESATCTIVRADDPDFEFVETRDMEWAKRMGLANNDNYRKQSGTMLQWRAISACARLACPEALYGVAYTPDEMGDMPSAPRAGGGLGAALSRPETITVTQESTPDAEPDEPDAESPLLNTSSKLAKHMFAALNKVPDVTSDEERLEFCSLLIGRVVTTSKELTDADAETIAREAEQGATLDELRAASGAVGESS